MTPSPSQAASGSRYSDLLRIAEALRNEKALFVLLVTNLLTGVLAFMGYATFLILLVLPVGVSIAGLLLMDQARGQRPRSLKQAIPDGLGAALRLIAVSLCSLALALVFYLLLCMLLLACKLPTVGPPLYAVLLPILAVLAGLLHTGFQACLFMAGPAIWNGCTIAETLHTLQRMASKHAVELLFSLFLLGTLLGLAGFALGGIGLAGYQFVLGASTFVLGDSFLGPTMSFLDVFKPGSFSSPYTLAFFCGAMIGLTLLITALASMSLMGMNLIYLRIAGEKTPAQKPAAPRNLRDKKEPTTQAVPSGPKPAIPTHDTGKPPGSNGAATDDILASLLAETPLPAARPPTCPKCRTPHQPGDHFCGECGGKLQG